MDQALRNVPITVLLPVYNSVVFLAATIQSILDQSYSEFELLIIDDLSTDGCKDVIRSFHDARIRTVFHQNNVGLNATLNEGIELAKGEYIARMDGDDLMHPERLKIQKRFLDEHPDVAVIASTVDLINTEGEITGVWDIDRACITQQQIRSMMPNTNCIAHPSVMIRRSALGANRYALEQISAEDWDLWMKLLSQGKKIAKIEQPLLKYRVHAASMMGRSKQKVPLEQRLMLARKRFILGEWRRGIFSLFHAAVMHAQARTFVRHLMNTGISRSRALKRMITYSPAELIRESRVFEETLASWNGRHIFLFPYIHMGGAEQIHAQIANVVGDQDPLIIIHGFSTDRSMYDRFATAGIVIELPHLLNHPTKAQPALQTLASKINTRKNAVLFGALSGIFFDLLPLLELHIRMIYLQHAFLYQPTGNVKHREWLKHFPRIDQYVFI
nr:glycosyltransferase [Bacteroidota bacterium]